MKKKLLYLGALVLYLLVACTLLSRKIEEEMATQVLIQEHSVANRYSAGGSMAADALFYVDGKAMLYEVMEGEGWESGTRLRLLEPDKWEYIPGKYPFLRFAGGSVYRFVETASRMPRDGGMAKAIDGFERKEDIYLLRCPDGLPEGWTPPEKWKILEKKETALLLAASEVETPFFQHRAKFRAGLAEKEEIELFSLTEMADFLEQLPQAALTAAVLLLPLVVWLLSVFLLSVPGKYRVSQMLNALLAAAAVAVLPWLLGRFSFPASVLPPESILDLAWYRAEFSGVFEEMAAMGDTALQGRWLAVREQLMWMLAASAGAGAGIVALEWLVTEIVVVIQNWRSRRYRGKYLAVKKRK